MNLGIFSLSAAGGGSRRRRHPFLLRFRRRVNRPENSDSPLRDLEVRVKNLNSDFLRTHQIMAEILTVIEDLQRNDAVFTDILNLVVDQIGDRGLVDSISSVVRETYPNEGGEDHLKNPEELEPA